MRFNGLESAGVVLFLGRGIAVRIPAATFEREGTGRHDFFGAFLAFRTRDLFGVHSHEFFMNLAAFAFEFVNRHSITSFKSRSNYNLAKIGAFNSSVKKNWGFKYELG